ncbi:unnamed protein product, partial [Mesorhabditis spiculigera]
MIVSEIPYTEEYMEATCSQPKTSESTLQLGSVKCYNINIQVEVEKSEQQAKGITTLTLREVPKFLVDAFNIIRSNIEKEGLFRKGGNNARINSYSKKILAIYQGRERIPLDLNYLDVCSLIKTFFKTLKHPLLHSRDIANALLTLADRKGAGESVSGEQLQYILRTRMPDYHLGTLCFLMRELNRVSQHNDRNGMTIQNLATCFGPTLFDLTAFDKPKGVPKRSMPGRVQTNPPTLSQLNEAKADSQRAATAVTILIEWATWIGLTRECYVSSQARSSSAAPINRYAGRQEACLTDATEECEDQVERFRLQERGGPSEFIVVAVAAIRAMEEPADLLERELFRNSPWHFRPFRLENPLEAEVYRLAHPIVEADGKQVFKLAFDVRRFKPEEVSISTNASEKLITVEVKHEDEMSQFSFTKKMAIPEGVTINEMSCRYDEDGVLTIRAPYVAPPKETPKLEKPEAKDIPIKHE